MFTLNLGCGPDPWGDVRVDIDFTTQTGIKSTINLRADAEHLPFRDKSFSECRCWHVLEHVRDPIKVIDEIRRTSQSASIRFPLDEGYYKQMFIGLIGLDPPVFLNAYRTLRRRAHKWIIRSSLGKRTDRFIEFPKWIVMLKYGRKARFLSNICRPLRYYYELEIKL